MNGASKSYGIIAEYRTSADVLHAAEKVRDQLETFGRSAKDAAQDGRDSSPLRGSVDNSRFALADHIESAACFQSFAPGWQKHWSGGT